MNKYSPMDVGNYPHDCLRNYVNEVKGHQCMLAFIMYYGFEGNSLGC